EKVSASGEMSTIPFQNIAAQFRLETTCYFTRRFPRSAISRRFPFQNIAAQFRFQGNVLFHAKVSASSEMSTIPI
ncbi:MAG: hypothetical protein ACI4XW_01695, partial [Candidatus Spyradocola sp.]